MTPPDPSAWHPPVPPGLHSCHHCHHLWVLHRAQQLVAVQRCALLVAAAPHNQRGAAPHRCGTWGQWVVPSKVEWWWECIVGLLLGCYHERKGAAWLTAGEEHTWRGVMWCDHRRAAPPSPQHTHQHIHTHTSPPPPPPLHCKLRLLWHTAGAT